MYNNYNGNYYNPNYNNPYYNNQPQAPQPSTNTNIIYANGVEDVKGRLLNNNSKYVFFDNDKQLIYVRNVDNVGKSEIQVYAYTPYENKPVPTIDPAQYVLKEEFIALKEEFEKLKAGE